MSATKPLNYIFRRTFQNSASLHVRWLIDFFGCRTKLNPQAKKSASPALNSFWPFYRELPKY
jgi:hypothetical protein